MRIAVLPSAYWPALGGVEELTRQLALAYVAEGHEVAIFTNRWPRDLPEREVRDGIAVHRLPFRTRHRSVRGSVSYLLTSRSVSRRLHALLAEHGTDVLHVQCVSGNTLYALRAKAELGLPLVVTTQGELTMDPAQRFARPGPLPQLMRAAAREADGFTACSARTLRDVEAFVGHPIVGARVIPNGADVRTFAGAERGVTRDTTVLAIGRLVREKGFDVLLRAWAGRPRHERRLVLVGAGPEDRSLQALADELGLDDVTFHGPAGRDEVPDLFASAAVVVLPSRADEGLPLVAIEALASGCALVTTDTGGVREVVTDGTDALVVPRDDVAALSAALARLVDEPALVTELGHAAQRVAQAFDWSFLADRYLECFAATLGAR